MPNIKIRDLNESFNMFITCLLLGLVIKVVVTCISETVHLKMGLMICVTACITATVFCFRM